MSEAENAITLPPPNQMLPNGSALTAWRATTDSIRVDALPNGGRNVIVHRDGICVWAYVLSAAAATHLAALLTGGGEASSGHGASVPQSAEDFSANGQGDFA